MVRVLILAFFPIFEEVHCLSPFCTMLVIGFLVDVLYQVMEAPFDSHVLSVFYLFVLPEIDVKFCQMPFSTFIESHMIFIL